LYADVRPLPRIPRAVNHATIGDENVEHGKIE
jgi:hypothetical protein